MRFYVVQVETGKEDKFLSFLATEAPELRERFLWLRRSLRVHRRGRWREMLSPVFPGYLFVQLEEVAPKTYRRVREAPGFLHFLRTNREIVPLSPRDVQLIRHFTSFGEVVRRSTVFFDEQGRIRVISGPLKGLEGKIVRVNRRKGRAKVSLDLYENSFLIDFGFEDLERAPERAEAVSSPPEAKEARA